MSDAALGDVPVLGLSLCVPRWGRWVVDVQIPDEAEAPSGRQTLTLLGSSWKGYVKRGGPFAYRTTVRLVGGDGGLETEAGPLPFEGLPVQSILDELLQAAGETRSADSSSEVLEAFLGGQWIVRTGPVGQLLTELLGQVEGAVWRVLADGTVWVGTESWPDSGLDLAVESQAPHRDQAVLLVDDASLRPGTLLAGRPVSEVRYLLGEDGLRALCAFETAE